MNKEQAYFIAYLRAGPVMHSLRRISELVFERYPEITSADLAGNQLEGQDLIREAFKIVHQVDHMEAHRLANEGHNGYKRLIHHWDI